MRGRSRDRHDNRPVQPRRDESRSRSNSRVSTNLDHVRCYRCREYNHFASECPNTPTDEETDYDDADPVSLQMMKQNYYPIDSEGEAEYLNLQKTRMVPPHFCHQKKSQVEKLITYRTKRSCVCLKNRLTMYTKLRKREILSILRQ